MEEEGVVQGDGRLVGQHPQDGQVGVGDLDPGAGRAAIPPTGSSSRVIGARTQARSSAEVAASQGRLRSTANCPRTSAGSPASSSISTSSAYSRNRGRAARSAPSATASSSQRAWRCSAAVRTTASTRARGPSAVRTRAREMPSSASTVRSSRSVERTYAG
ncbi:hypothetical protein [Streptomyces sp. NPDC057877]|uniref:hypothetical protein n=1 Tax=Streptomyces sp. NPDC057877 TaxID=3346269 RepID=UPI0036C0CE16